MGIGELKGTFDNNRGKLSFGVGRSKDGGARMSGGMFRCCSCRGTAHQGTLRIAQCTNFRSSRIDATKIRASQKNVLSEQSAMSLVPCSFPRRTSSRLVK